MLVQAFLDQIWFQCAFGEPAGRKNLPYGLIEVFGGIDQPDLVETLDNSARLRLLTNRCLRDMIVS